MLAEYLASEHLLHQKPASHHRCSDHIRVGQAVCSVQRGLKGIGDNSAGRMAKLMPHANDFAFTAAIVGMQTKKAGKV